MSEAAFDPGELDVREQIASIDQKLADASRKRQEIAYEPWKVLAMGMTAGAALFAAGGAFFKLLLG